MNRNVILVLTRLYWVSFNRLGFDQVEVSWIRLNSVALWNKSSWAVLSSLLSSSSHVSPYENFQNSSKIPQQK